MTPESLEGLEMRVVSRVENRYSRVDFGCQSTRGKETSEEQIYNDALLQCIRNRQDGATNNQQFTKTSMLREMGSGKGDLEGISRDVPMEQKSLDEFLSVQGLAYCIQREVTEETSSSGPTQIGRAHV